MNVDPLPLSTRLWFSFVCLFRVLFDAAFAGRVWTVREALPAPPPPPALPEEPAIDPLASSLQLLALLQREGRLVDFLEQDITSFSDEDVGAAARVVHQGCGKALRAHATIAPVRDEAEDEPVEVAAGYDPAEIKLTGKVSGKAPYRGTLRHRGWRISSLRLPTAVAGHDLHVVAPAEVEL